MAKGKIKDPRHVTIDFDKGGGCARIIGFAEVFRDRLHHFNEILASIGQEGWTQSVQVVKGALVVTYADGVPKKHVRAGIHNLTKPYGVFVSNGASA